MNKIDLIHEISIIGFLQFGKLTVFSFHTKSFAYIEMPFFRLKKWQNVSHNKIIMVMIDSFKSYVSWDGFRKHFANFGIIMV
jgi:hypothetical protein